MPKMSPEELRKGREEMVDRLRAQWDQLADDMRAEGWSEQRILEAAHRLYDDLIDYIRALKPQ